MQRGERIGGRFEIDEHVASGGMGQVFRARDVQSGETVAVKMLLGDGAALGLRFDRERQTLAKLSHPSIVRYVAHGLTSTGAPYLAMEWLEGEDLAGRLARGRLSLEDSLALAARIADAMHAAHARGIVHRDLKPSNIFLVNGRVDRMKLLDFGIARMASGTRMTGTGMMLGTPGYMAPEQAGTERSIDARADVFSLGCVLFECLAGAPAFQAEHPMALLAKLVFAETPRLADVMPAAPEALDALLARMMAKDPADRPPHGGAVAEALAALTLQTGTGTRAGISADASPRPQPPAPGLTRDEQRMVSVILVGSSREEDREATTLPLAQVEATLRQGASTWGGQVEQLRDGSVAMTVGGKGPVTDQAAQAARCALWLQARVAGRPMALATGRSDRTGKLPAADTIDRAAELLLLRAPSAGDPAAAGGIAIDEVTTRLLDAHFDVRARGRGYTLHGEQELALGTRLLLGRATPCVGRDMELRTLEQLFEECTEEPAARAALVTAPPGTGKSRLTQELLRAVRARAEAVSVQLGRGEPHRAGSAFSLLAQLVRGACGIQAGEPLELQRDKLVARAGQPIAELLGELVGAPFPDDNSLPLRAARQDPQLLNERMREAFIELLRAETAAHPVVLVLEDLHWGDLPTVQFLDAALRDLRDSPLFILALARPEVYELFPRLWAERSIQQLPLKQLGKKASERLVRHVLGAAAEQGLVDRLVRLSEGNAFYLEELIRAAAEGQRDDLPRTVVAMVQSRLAALDDDARRILRAASVFGEVFWPGAVAELLGSARGAAGMEPTLAELLDRELILRRKQSRFPDEDEYAFRHALLREGAYTMLTDEDRVLGHRLAGEWLEEHGEQDPLALAEHLERGGERPRAGLHYLRAAEQASRGADFTASIARVRRALDCGVPDDVRVRSLGMLCELHFFKMELQTDALAYADEVMRIAPPGTGPWSQGLLVKIVSSLQAGNSSEFEALLETAGATPPAPGAAFPWSLCMAVGVFLLDVLGRVRAANALLEAFTACVRAVGEEEPHASMVHLSLLTTRTAYAEEEPMRGLEDGLKYLQLSEAVSQRRYVELAKYAIGMNRWYLGVLEGTDRMILDASLSDSDGGLVSSYRPFILTWLLAERGRLDEARQWGARLIESGRTRGLPIDEGRGHWALAEVLRRAGDLAAAAAEIDAALAILRPAAPLDVPGALATLAALRLAQGRAAEALAAAEDGIARHEAMGACSFFRGAFLRLVHVQCLAAAGAPEAAKAALAGARDRLFAIAEKIGDPEYRRSFLEDVPENRQTLELARQSL
jgi:eukaryotic-like serine/threonine-protein kinase